MTDDSEKVTSKNGAKNSNEGKFGKKYYGRMFAGIVVAIVVISVIGAALYYSGNPDSEETLLLATTTSTANSGLLDEIIPDFEDEYDVRVKVTPVGTGQALEMGRRGDVDVLMVHAPSREIDFVNNGYGTGRFEVCYNYFVILGPEDDPAGIKNAGNVSDAMKKIFDTKSEFASRGDDSGTHTKERSLWETAGFDYEKDIDLRDNDWYKSVSAGMGDTLVRANELQAYTLSDEGTFWSMASSVDLEIILREDPALMNQYSVIPLNKDKFSHVNYESAMDFTKWIRSTEIQNKIANFEANGHKLFVPNAET